MIILCVYKHLCVRAFVCASVSVFMVPSLQLLDNIERKMKGTVVEVRFLCLHVYWTAGSFSYSHTCMCMGLLQLFCTCMLAQGL